MPSRRQFLQTTAGTGLLGMFGDDLLARAGVAAAAENDMTPEMVQLRPEIEPVVRLIEQTPRERCFERVAELLRGGLPYRHFLAALYLAGIRNVSPQPPGFKFHCVFVIHAAHQLSLDAPVQDRLLPLFWALDDFKASQQKDEQEGDFRLGPVKGRLPAPERAWDELHAAMQAWDEERADRAIAALVRSRGGHEVIEGLWQYGARDYRNIGHKAIFVANTWRTLQTIGWQHAEPALRSLVLGLLDFKDRRVNDYAFDDQSWLPNVERARQAIDKLPGDWTATPGERGASAPRSGQGSARVSDPAAAAGDPQPTRDLLDILRAGDVDAACTAAVEQLAAGRARAGAVWDAVHLAAGELMMRQPGIYGIHTVTSANGLRYAYETSGDAQTRLVLLLQGLGWMGQFRNFMASRPNGLNDVRITDLPPADVADSPEQAAEDILSLVSRDAPAAAARALSYAKRHADLRPFTQTALQLIFRKATDAHDYKYAAAAFEDHALVSDRWRPELLATAVYHLRGSTLPDSPVMQQAREAVRTL